jgi:hypothetical protein
VDADEHAGIRVQAVSEERKAVQNSLKCMGCGFTLGEENPVHCHHCNAMLSEVGIWDKSVVREILRPGGVYLTFSGDYDIPYRFAKIIRMDGEDIWAKLHREKHVDRPPSFDPDAAGEYKVIPISVDVILGWGPPKFPIHVADEIVTENELEQCTEECYLSNTWKTG